MSWSRTCFCLAGLLLVAGADWPQFLGPSRDGISTEKALLTSWPKEGPPVVWSKKVGAGFSGPVVAGDRLILFHRVDDREVVQCLHAGTGKERWKFSYPTGYQDDFGFDEGPRSTPLIAGTRVYTLGAEGVLHCLELETGKKVWARPLNEDYQVRKGFFGVATSPLVEAGLVLINVGGKDAGIVALAKDTGKEVWRATDHGASYSSPVAATIQGTRHVFFFTRQGLVSLDPRNGHVRFSKHWRSRLDASVNAAAPVVVGKHVFISACYQAGAALLRVDKDAAQEVWKSDDVLSNHYATSIHYDGYLYGFDGRQENGARLRCVEMKSGKVRWTQEGFGCGSMVVAGGNLIVLTEDGDLVLIEATPRAYREKARAVLLTKPCRALIALANGRLYARDGKKLVCVNLEKQK
ncbi:MAG TPA: PQQ-binding-like beta-propeller repeat protein [Gemmataceae bacterium]|jgi:outer membrane protein assembly factor BamB|nr:PQQ-binding-like beta-propeller repeat protein [Gemmataceae bacterium]